MFYPDPIYILPIKFPKKLDCLPAKQIYKKNNVLF